MRFDRDFVLLLIAGILLVVCLARPTFPTTHNTFHYLFVLDITQSMNARDYRQNDLPSDRLSFAKRAVRRVIRDLPCGSTAGVGLFSTQHVVLLIDLLEICAHFAALDDTISNIDWRMAWSADSNIERGLYGAILATRSLVPGTRLVFLSDGEQTVQELHRPPIFEHRDNARGFIFGVGKLQAVAIPKLDQNNRVLGFWERSEVDEVLLGVENRKNAPDEFADSEPYLSRLHEDNLQFLAMTSGLAYHRLESPRQFSNILQQDVAGISQRSQADVRWIFAFGSLVLVVLVYQLPARIIRSI